MPHPQYKLIKATQNWDGRQPWEMQFSPESDKNTSLGDIKMLRSSALNLFSNLGSLRACILDKAMFSVGTAFLPKYLGDDSDFAAEAVPWLIDQWMPVCNLMGEEFPFAITFNLVSCHLDVFGEAFIYLTQYPDSGFPAIQLIPCWRVDQPRQGGALGSGNRLTGRCFGGAFTGQKCEWGVIKNPQGRAIGFHVLGNADDGSQDALVSADNLIRVRDSALGDETRGIPSMSHGILQGRSVLSLISNEQEFLESAGRIALLENNELGGLSADDPSNALSIRPAVSGYGTQAPVAGQTPNPNLTEEWNPGAGQNRYFPLKGGTVSAFQLGQRPRQEWDQFISRISKLLIDPIFPFSLIEKEENLGSAMARAIVGRCNRLIQERQAILLRPARKVLQYACAKAHKIGRLPDSDAWYQWSCTTPARVTTDFGRDGKEELLEMEAGVRLPSEIVTARGMGNYADFLRQRYTDLALDQIIRKEVSDEYGVDLSGVVEPLITGSGQADTVD